jgi:transcriptional regulator with XRE-family HTH domain
MRELLPSGQVVTLRLLNKMTVSELAELSNLSKAYISQVKHGKRPPSQKLLEALGERRDALRKGLPREYRLVYAVCDCPNHLRSALSCPDGHHFML